MNEKIYAIVPYRKPNKKHTAQAAGSFIEGEFLEFEKSSPEASKTPLLPAECPVQKIEVSNEETGSDQES